MTKHGAVAPTPMVGGFLVSFNGSEAVKPSAATITRSEREWTGSTARQAVGAFLCVMACGSPPAPLPMSPTSPAFVERQLSQRGLFVPAPAQELARALGSEIEIADSAFVQTPDGMVLRFDMALVRGSEAALRNKLATIVQWARDNALHATPVEIGGASAVVVRGVTGPFDCAIDVRLFGAPPPIVQHGYVLSASFTLKLPATHLSLERVVRNSPALTGGAVLPNYFLALLAEYPLREFGCRRKHSSCSYWHFVLDDSIEPMAAMSRLMRANSVFGFAVTSPRPFEANPDPYVTWVESYQACSSAALSYRIVDGRLNITLQSSTTDQSDATSLLRCAASPVMAEPPPSTLEPQPGWSQPEANVERVISCYERGRHVKPLRGTWSATDESGQQLQLTVADGGRSEPLDVLAIGAQRAVIRVPREKLGFSIQITERLDANTLVSLIFVHGEATDAAEFRLTYVEEGPEERALAVGMGYDALMRSLDRPDRFVAAVEAVLKREFVHNPVQSAAERTSHRRRLELLVTRGARFHEGVARLYPFGEPGCSLRGEESSE